MTGEISNNWENKVVISRKGYRFNQLYSAVAHTQLCLALNKWATDSNINGNRTGNISLLINHKYNKIRNKQICWKLLQSVGARSLTVMWEKTWLFIGEWYLNPNLFLTSLNKPTSFIVSTKNEMIDWKTLASRRLFRHFYFSFIAERW